MTSVVLTQPFTLRPNPQNWRPKYPPVPTVEFLAKERVLPRQTARECGQAGHFSPTRIAVN